MSSPKFRVIPEDHLGTTPNVPFVVEHYKGSLFGGSWYPITQLTNPDRPCRFMWREDAEAFMARFEADAGELQVWLAVQQEA